MKSKKAHYGYYGLPILSIMMGIIFLIGVLILLHVSKLFGWLIVGFGLYILVTYGISMMWVQRKGREDFPDILKIEGGEWVLDVGCGLGRISIEIAKRLKDGRVIGIDIWDKKELWTNSPEKAYANAEIEGVKEKVEFKYGNVLGIPFPDNTFDLVTSSSLLNNLRGNDLKLKALFEIHRVLKPGGRFFMLEPLRSLRMFFLFTPFAFWGLLKEADWVKLLNKVDFVNLKYHYQDGVGFFAVERSETS
jgi:arsenite methyltransferase